MLFGAKKQNSKPVDTLSKTKLEPYEIHVMPPKFHKYLELKKGMSFGKLALILGVSFVILAGIGLGVYFLIYQGAGPSPEPQINLNTPVVEPNANVPVENANVVPNLNDLNLENLNITPNTNELANLNVNANTNQPANVNQPLEPVANYSSSVDADSDLLTDVEEGIYDTEKNMPDTDSDGFLDGEEVRNGYNPKAAGASLMENAGLATKYTNPNYNYEILYPAAWLVKPTDQSLKDVIFQSATGEYIELIIEDNPNQEPIAQWYVNKFGDANVSQLQKITLKNGFEALINPDKLNYYLVSTQQPTLVYAISYKIGTKTRVNFLTSYQMMINSFKLIARNPAIETPTNTNQ